MDFNQKKELVDKNDTYLERITAMLEYVIEKNFDFDFSSSLLGARYIIEMIEKQVELNNKSNSELNNKSNSELKVLANNHNTDPISINQINKILLNRIKNNQLSNVIEDLYFEEMNDKKSKTSKNNLHHLLKKYDKVGYFEQIHTLRLQIIGQQEVCNYDDCLKYAKKIEKIILSQMSLINMSLEELKNKVEDNNSTVQELKFIKSLADYQQISLFDIAYCM